MPIPWSVAWIRCSFYGGVSHVCSRSKRANRKSTRTWDHASWAASPTSPAMPSWTEVQSSGSGNTTRKAVPSHGFPSARPTLQCANVCRERKPTFATNSAMPAPSAWIVRRAERQGSRRFVISRRSGSEQGALCMSQLQKITLLERNHDIVPEAEKLHAVLGLTKKCKENACLPESENKQETRSLKRPSRALGSRRPSQKPKRRPLRRKRGSRRSVCREPRPSFQLMAEAHTSQKNLATSPAKTAVSSQGDGQPPPCCFPRT